MITSFNQEQVTRSQVLDGGLQGWTKAEKAAPAELHKGNRCEMYDFTSKYVTANQ